MKILKQKAVLSKLSFSCIFLVRIIPQLIQILITFFLTYLNFNVINQTQTAMDLIQNFAGLAIILEFDNIVVAVLRYLRIFIWYKTLFLKFKIQKMSKNLPFPKDYHSFRNIMIIFQLLKKHSKI